MSGVQDYQFAPGQSGNLAGRPPGKAIKTKMKLALPAAIDVVIANSNKDLASAIAVVNYCSRNDLG